MSVDLATFMPALRGMGPDDLARRPHYDDSPRPITPREAATLAAAEYGYRRGDRAWLCLSRGSDGGMHYRDRAYSEAAACGWCEEKQRALVRRIMRGECSHTVQFDRGRDRFYLA